MRGVDRETQLRVKIVRWNYCFNFSSLQRQKKKSTTTTTNKKKTNKKQHKKQEKKNTKKNFFFSLTTNTHSHTQQEQQQLALRFAFCGAKTTKSTNDDDKTEENTFWVVYDEWDEKTAPFLSSHERRERFGFIRCDWCRLDDVFLGVYDRVVEQQYLFEKKEQSALRERERWRRGGVFLRRRDDNNNKSVV